MNNNEVKKYYIYVDTNGRPFVSFKPVKDRILVGSTCLYSEAMKTLVKFASAAAK